MKQKAECSYERKLNAYIAGELSESKHNNVQKHISRCHLCQNEIRNLLQVDDFLDQYTEEEVPAGFNERMLKSVSSTKVNPLIRKIIDFSIAASIVLAFTAGVVLSNDLYTENSDNNFTLGENSLYSYFEGDLDA
ncbi:MAG: hypothetical protein K9N07_00335 [Candidatus Cloacimonetes bacterium]|nr:hypothetical protein [Candidatus Cloacimonadota bacterium]